MTASVFFFALSTRLSNAAAADGGSVAYDDGTVAAVDEANV